MVDDPWLKRRYYNVAGAPAIVQGAFALKAVKGCFRAVTPSGVRNEGVEISESEFDALAAAHKARFPDPSC
jgi:hypothetical protein